MEQFEIIDKVKLDQENYNNVSKVTQETNNVVIEKLNDFYKFLVLLSGSSIVASVTFISGNSFSKTEIAKIGSATFSNLDFLYLSWVLLLLSLVFGLLRNLNHTFYLHWSVAHEHLKAKAKLDDDKMILKKHGLLSNPEVLNDEIYEKNKNVYTETIKKFDLNQTKSYRKSSAYEKLSLIFFIFGLAFLIAFSAFTLGF